MIDWPKVLQTNGIPYKEGGKSTAKNNIYVHCPLCGNADEGYHMGISVRGRGWGCWRNAKHRGKSPVRLLAMLLNVSLTQAEEMLGITTTLFKDEDLSTRLKGMLEKTVATPVEAKGNLIDIFSKQYDVISRKASHKKFWEYLKERGYTDANIEDLCLKYNLRCEPHGGAFRYRIIIPIITKEGLVTWTGRSIVSGKEPRYLTLPTNPETAKALGCPTATRNIKDCLLDEYKLFEAGNMLVVCEGPFDAINLTRVAGMKTRITCMFGKSLSAKQLSTLDDIAHYYKNKVILLDPDAALDNLAMWDKVQRMGFRMVRIPAKYGDPGDMPASAARKFLQSLD